MEGSADWTPLPMKVKRQREWAVAAALAIALTACAGSSESGPPRTFDSRLERLRRDPIRSLVLPDSRRVDTLAIRTCEGDSDSGPSVTDAFSSKLSGTETLRRYRKVASAAGWTYDSSYNVSGSTNRDAKADVYKKRDPRLRALLWLEIRTIHRQSSQRFETNLYWGDPAPKCKQSRRSRSTDG